MKKVSDITTERLLKMSKYLKLSEWYNDLYVFHIELCKALKV